MTKPLLLLVAVTLCCCMASLHAYSRFDCQCLRYAPGPVPYRAIKTIVITPITGGCRRPEAVITRKNSSKVCVDPSQPWFLALLKRVQNSQKVASPSSNAPPTTSLPPSASLPPTSGAAELAVKLNSTVN